MIRFLLRLLSMVALAVAVIMAVLDATRTIAASALVTTPLGVSWAAASPETLEWSRGVVIGKVHPLAWDSLVDPLLALPGFAVFAVIALILFVLGRKPTRRLGRFAVEN